jgi:molecular chaperone GrpE
MKDSGRGDEDFEGEIAIDAEAEAREGDDIDAGSDLGERGEAERRLEELNDKHLRLVAEFSNYRRRTEQERLNAWGRAQADVIAKFLDVLDDLHRVAQLDLGNATVETIMEGIDLVERKFSRMLEDAGVEAIDPLGHPFDPQTMEAITRMPAETAEQEERPLIDPVSRPSKSPYAGIYRS